MNELTISSSLPNQSVILIRFQYIFQCIGLDTISIKGNKTPDIFTMFKNFCQIYIREYREYIYEYLDANIHNIIK